MDSRKLQEGITYDDLLLIPQYSDIESRKEVNLSTTIAGIKLTLPIIAANMDTICGVEMALAMGKVGGMGILHRFESHETILEWIKTLKANKVPAVPSIGIKPEDYEKALMYIKAGADAICIDVAHGHCKRVLEITELLSSKTKVIAGNIATANAAIDLIKAGAACLKVGIGPGSNCSTRVVTGHGMPQATALENVVGAIPTEIGVIADGGLKSSGDIVKALALGANAVMTGSLLAGTVECPNVGDTVDGKYIYRGMASREARATATESSDPLLKGNYTPEGVTRLVEAQGKVKYVVEDLAGGIRSGFSYSGASNLEELWENAEFIKVSRSAYMEGLPQK